MKLSLREKIRVANGLLILGLAFMLFSGVAPDAVLWLILLAAVCIIGGAIFSVTQIRCPHCGKWLGRYYGEYCSHCGVKFDFDAK